MRGMAVSGCSAAFTVDDQARHKGLCQAKPQAMRSALLLLTGCLLAGCGLLWWSGSAPRVRSAAPGRRPAWGRLPLRSLPPPPLPLPTSPPPCMHPSAAGSPLPSHLWHPSTTAAPLPLGRLAAAALAGPVASVGQLQGAAAAPAHAQPGACGRRVLRPQKRRLPGIPLNRPAGCRHTVGVACERSVDGLMPHAHMCCLPTLRACAAAPHSACRVHG